MSAAVVENLDSREIACHSAIICGLTAADAFAVGPELGRPFREAVRNNRGLFLQQGEQGEGRAVE